MAPVTAAKRALLLRIAIKRLKMSMEGRKVNTICTGDSTAQKRAIYRLYYGCVVLNLKMVKKWLSLP